MNLVTVPEYRVATSTTEADDDKLDLALEAASQAILNYTDRDFGTVTVTENRTYLYDGKGFLEIDDCTAVNTVTVAGTVISSSLYYPMPFRGPVYTWLELPPQRLVSGAMGFTYNLDTYLQRLGFQTLEVVVNSDWGWNFVPADVKQAVIWTAGSMLQNPAASGALSAESVAEVARSYAISQQQGTPEGIPARSMEILDYYRRPVI